MDLATVIIFLGKNQKPISIGPNRAPQGHVAVSFTRDVCRDLLQALKSGVMYLILAPHDNEQYDLLQRIKDTEQLDDLPIYMYGLFFVLPLAETRFG